PELGFGRAAARPWPAAPVRPGRRSPLIPFVLPGAVDVAFGVLEEDQLADAFDAERLHDHLAAVLLDGGDGRLEVLDAEAELHAGHGLAADLAPPLQGADEAVAGAARLVEAGRPPGSEAPAEHLLVEALGARDVLGVDREVAQRGGHRSFLPAILRPPPYPERRVPAPWPAARSLRRGFRRVWRSTGERS